MVLRWGERWERRRGSPLLKGWGCSPENLDQIWKGSLMWAGSSFIWLPVTTVAKQSRKQERKKEDILQFECLASKGYYSILNSLFSNIILCPIELPSCNWFDTIQLNVEMYSYVLRKETDYLLCFVIDDINSGGSIGEGPGGPGSPPLFWVKKKKWLKEEKPAGQVNQNRPPPPPP